MTTLTDLEAHARAELRRVADALAERPPADVRELLLHCAQTWLGVLYIAYAARAATAAERN